MASKTAATEKSPNSSLQTLLFCFFLSGAAGLIYQVAWTKSLSLLFGHNTYAVATVLAIFLGGLALGSATFARYAELSQKPIALYAWLELLIAATALLSFLGLAAVRATYLAIHPSVSSFPLLLILIRILGTTIVLLPPALLMGATFPILIRGVTRHSSELSRRLSRFYAINTFGAVAGTLAAGFFLLPTIGIRLTIVAAVLLNIVAGLAALQFSRRLNNPLPAPETAIPEKQSSKKLSLTPSTVSPTKLLITFALVGATAIAYEIAWTRLLATMLGSSTYAFTLMLATFLAGIALGSMLFEKWANPSRALTVAMFSHSQTVTALAALFFLLLFRQLPGLIPQLLKLSTSTFSGIIFAQFVICALAMLPAALVFGFNFPLVVSLIAASRPGSAHSIRDVGRSYAASTAGAIFSALAIGFFLLPKIGAFRVVAITAVLNLLLAIFLYARIPTRRNVVIPVQCAVLAITAFVGFSSHFYDKALASFSAVLYGSFHQDRLTLDEIANTEDVIFFEDGLNATISVTRSEDYVALKTNGKVDASTVDTSTQLLLGHLGAIFHPHPRRVLIIGFGGGMTASAVARYPDVETIDCVEIEPAVLHAAYHLARLNRGVLQDPRLHIIYDDARNFVQTSTQPYDLIISEPSNPWIAGVATLYTKEFYATVRTHLAPGGIFVQWVQAYGLQPDDFRMILATLAPNFPNLSLWRSADRDFLLLARTDSTPLNFDRSRKLWNDPGLQSDFRELHLTRPESWPLYFRQGDKPIRLLVADADTNTDDLTLLEYTAPRSILYDPQAQTITALVDQLSIPLLPNLSAVDHDSALLATAESSAEINAPLTAVYLTELDKLKNGAPTQVLWGRVAQMHNRHADAISRFESHKINSTNLYNVDYWLAQSYLHLGHFEKARASASIAIQLQPTALEPHTILVDVFRASHDYASAVSAQKQLIDSQSHPAASEYCTLGDLYLRSNERTLARQPFLDGLARDPYAYLCHRDLGELDRATGHNEEARTNLEFVVRYFPEADAKAYVSLALTYVGLNKREEAENALKKGKRIFPQDSFLQNFRLPN